MEDLACTELPPSVWNRAEFKDLGNRPREHIAIVLSAHCIPLEHHLAVHHLDLAHVFVGIVGKLEIDKDVGPAPRRWSCEAVLYVVDLDHLVTVHAHEER